MINVDTVAVGSIQVASGSSRVLRSEVVSRWPLMDEQMRCRCVLEWR